MHGPGVAGMPHLPAKPLHDCHHEADCEQRSNDNASFHNAAGMAPSALLQRRPSSSHTAMASRMPSQAQHSRYPPVSDP